MHLRLKQNRIATIALLPGVNISVSIVDSPIQEVRPQPSLAPRQSEGGRNGRDLMSIIADAIWPHLRPRVEECITLAEGEDLHSSGSSQRRNKRKPPTQSHLPLKSSKR